MVLLVQGPGALQVGMACLLQPGATAKWARALALVCGCGYPAYRTFKAARAARGGAAAGVAAAGVAWLERTLLGEEAAAAAGSAGAAGGAGAECERVMHYWAVYGALTFMEGLAGRFLELFPWYPHLKLGAVLWLQTAPYNGASKVFAAVEPSLAPHEREIDRALRHVQGPYSRAVSQHSEDIRRALEFCSDMLAASQRVMLRLLRKDD